MLKRLLVSLGVVAFSLTAMSQPASGSRATPAPEWINDAVIYEVNVRQYTEAGTFDAFATHLPRLRDLGVDVLWFMPITPISQTKRNGTLGSYYSVDNYTEVNPEFGTAQDFEDLVTQAHDLGFKVILDWVANHTGWDNPWITAHPDWYTKNGSGDITHPAGTNWTDVADLNFNNTAMRAAMIDAMKYWVTEFEIDGFRCDFAAGVPVSFWNEASAQLNQIKPLFMLAEEGGDMELLNSAFDANYAWDYKDAFNSIGLQQEGASLLLSEIKTNKSQFPANTFSMNFITNHDENSWSGTEFERLGKNVNTLTAIYFTLPGLPLIYTGQEISLNRRLKFFDKDAIDWNAGVARPLLAQLAKLKADNSALDVGAQPGSFTAIPTSDDAVFAYVRKNNDQSVVVMANVSPKARTVKLNLTSASGYFREITSNVKTRLFPSTSITLPPFGFKVLSSDLEDSVTQTVSKISVPKKELRMAKGSSFQVLPTLSPRHVTNSTVVWKSSNPKIAKVFSNGTIKAISRGVATITAITSNTAVKAGVKVTVK
ncbi:MAG: hypothetical protein RIS75_1108 [Actinomycetota bacterium]